MSTLSVTQQHIEAFAKVFPDPASAPVAYSFLLRYGRPFTPVKAAETGTQRLGHCYLNAIKFTGGATRYCEGFAISANLFPMPHAWNTIDGLACTDPTWEDGSDYFGVAFTHAFRNDFSSRTGLTSIFEGLYALRGMGKAGVVEYLESGIQTF